MPGRYRCDLEYRRRRSRKEMTRVLFIGYNRNTRQLVEWFNQHPHFGYTPTGILNRETDQVGKHLENIAYDNPHFPSPEERVVALNEVKRRLDKAAALDQRKKELES